MMPFLSMFVLQLIIAAIVIFVLKNLLDRELEKAAIEKLMSLKADSTIKTVNIYYAHSMPSKIEKELIHLTKNKFSDSKVVFEQNKILKGGLVIKAADVVLDYSLSSRLDHLWS